MVYNQDPADGPLAAWSSFLVLPVAVAAGFLAYMVIGLLASLVWAMAAGGDLSELMTLQEGNNSLQALIGGNAVGLLFGLGALGFVLARMDSSRPWAVLRFNRPRMIPLVVAVVGLAALQPVVFWLGEINGAIPMPEFIRTMEEQQLELIRWIIQGDGSLALNLMFVAVIPGICEEVFFRGYFQRRAERSWGAAWGIAISGIVFGLFHFRLSEALPLCALGLYMAYLAWCTGSLWVPVVVHFANNAGALILARSNPDAMMETPEISWIWVLLGTVGFVVVIRILHSWKPINDESAGLD